MTDKYRAVAMPIHVMLLLTAAAIICWSALAGCGGGFSGDSSNADDFGESIFGPAGDTTNSR